jgi:hypothetical protein
LLELKDVADSSKEYLESDLVPKVNAEMPTDKDLGIERAW